MLARNIEKQQSGLITHEGTLKRIAELEEENARLKEEYFRLKEENIHHLHELSSKKLDILKMDARIDELENALKLEDLYFN